MLARTHNPVAPWIVVRADNKHQARLNLIKDMLTRLQYHDKDESALLIDPEVVFQYEDSYVKNGMISP